MFDVVPPPHSPQSTSDVEKAGNSKNSSRVYPVHHMLELKVRPSPKMDGLMSEHAYWRRYARGPLVARDGAVISMSAASSALLLAVACWVDPRNSNS